MYNMCSDANYQSTYELTVCQLLAHMLVGIRIVTITNEQVIYQVRLERIRI